MNLLSSLFSEERLELKIAQPQCSSVTTMLWNTPVKRGQKQARCRKGQKIKNVFLLHDVQRIINLNTDKIYESLFFKYILCKLHFLINKFLLLQILLFLYRAYRLFKKE